MGKTKEFQVKQKITHTGKDVDKKMDRRALAGVAQWTEC